MPEFPRAMMTSYGVDSHSVNTLCQYCPREHQSFAPLAMDPLPYPLIPPHLLPGATTTIYVMTGIDIPAK